MVGEKENKPDKDISFSFGLKESECNNYATIKLIGFQGFREEQGKFI